MRPLTVSYQFDEDIVRRMASLQVSLYAGRYQAITMGLAVVLIYMGLAVVSGTVLKFVLIGLGCFSFSLFLFPRMNQVKIVKSTFGNHYPKCQIHFEKDQIDIEMIGSKVVKYSEISRLLMTRRDFFIEAKDHTLVCIPRKLIQEPMGFQSCMTEVTGLKWIKPRLGPL